MKPRAEDFTMTEDSSVTYDEFFHSLTELEQDYLDSWKHQQLRELLLGELSAQPGNTPKEQQEHLLAKWNATPLPPPEDDPEEDAREIREAKDALRGFWARMQWQVAERNGKH